MRRAVFLDRDGVINEAIVRGGKPYPPTGVDQTIVVSGAEKALAKLREHGFLLIVISNQPDVARGSALRSDIEEIHQFLAARLALDDFFVCYHDDQDGCNCRKPKPGLILAALEKYAIDIHKSYLIGDRWRDIDAGHTAGCRTIFIDHRYNERSPSSNPDARVASLNDAVDWILQREAEFE